MLRAIFLSLLILGDIQGMMKDYKIEPDKLKKTKYQSINILDAKELDFKDIDGVEIKELSALAYKNNILYALTDKGILIHFDMGIQNNKIQKVDISKVFVLKDENAKKLEKGYRDSEGLCFLGEDLLISFEKKHRIDLYTTSGIKIQNQKLHKDIKKRKNYRAKNKGLESVAYSEKYGIITAPEKSLSTEDEEQHIVYSKTKKWMISASGSISALEFMSKNKLMILERKINKLTQKKVITISSLNLKSSKHKILAKLDSENGWRVDNFEGLTKVDENKYLMISDDNDSFFQKTLLVLFEIED
ncbi:MAG: esterase-like activity of phytase family protein [Sulfurimonas sp.]|nr:esterase-like activity of phytase family protein [Sulfurimonas sp.]